MRFPAIIHIVIGCVFGHKTIPDSKQVNSQKIRYCVESCKNRKLKNYMRGPGPIYSTEHLYEFQTIQINVMSATELLIGYCKLPILVGKQELFT